MPHPADTFTAPIPLLALPDRVLFPHVQTLLQLVAPRDQMLAEQALEGSRLIALGLLRPGWEADAGGQPAIHEHVCVARIVSAGELPSGGFRLLIEGAARGVVAETTIAWPYRLARIAEVADVEPPAEVREPLRRQLFAALRQLFAGHGVERHGPEVYDSSAVLGRLVDQVAHAAGLDPEDARDLLAEPRVEQRVQRLLTLLEPRPVRRFPLAVSVN